MRQFFTAWVISRARISPFTWHAVLKQRARPTRARAGSSLPICFRAWARRSGCAYPTFDWACGMIGWPPILPNVWLGTSIEDQKNADERIPDLLDTPAAKRFVSCEPLLGPIDLTRVCIVPRRPGSHRPVSHRCAQGQYNESGMPYIGQWDSRPMSKDAPARHLDWAIAGGESGRTLDRCTRIGHAACAINAKPLACRFSSSSGENGSPRINPAPTSTPVPSAVISMRPAMCVTDRFPTPWCTASARKPPAPCSTARVREMRMPERIRLSRAKGWRMPEDAVKVDRSTPWSNPFKAM